MRSISPTRPGVSSAWKNAWASKMPIRASSASYLSMLDQRMCRVADTMAFFTAWQIIDYRDLYKRMACVAPEDRAVIEANLCRFDFDCFDEMGDDIERIIHNAEAFSRYLDGRDFFLPAGTAVSAYLMG